MAMVTIDVEDTEGNLPRVCAVSGEPTDDLYTRSFTYTPSWTAIFIIFGLLPAVILAAIVRKRMRVELPIAQEFQNHWSKRVWRTCLGLVGAIGLGFGAFALFSSLAPKGGPDPDMTGYACAGCCATIFVWIVAALYMNHTAIRATYISEYEITLTNVHEDFADAVRRHNDEMADDEDDVAERIRQKLKQKKKKKRPAEPDDDEYDD